MARPKGTTTAAKAVKEANEAKKAPVAAKDRRVLGERGHLTKSVRKVTDAYVTGELKLDLPLTPHRVASIIEEKKYEKERPSVGAVTAVFKRWQTQEFATFTETPFAFKGYTAQGKKLGHTGLLEKRREARKAATAERNAAKAASKPPAKKAASKPPAKKAAAKKAAATK